MKITNPNKRKRTLSDEDLRHVVIDGIGGLHFDMEYFRELPGFKKAVEDGLKAMEEEVEND